MNFLKLMVFTFCIGCKNDFREIEKTDENDGEADLFFVLQNEAGEIAKVNCDKNNVVVVNTSDNEFNVVIKQKSFNSIVNITKIRFQDEVLWNDGVIRVKGDLNLGVFKKKDAEDSVFLKKLTQSGASVLDQKGLILSEEEFDEKYRKLLFGD